MMAAKQKHRTAGNSYNFRQRVDFPIEIQLDNDSALLNEFFSQSLGSKSGSDASDTDTSIDLGINTLVTQESEDSVEELSVVCQKIFF